MSYLRYLYLFPYSRVQHILWWVLVFGFYPRLVCTVLPVSLNCPFLIAPSLFSNVYFKSISPTPRILVNIVLCVVCLHFNMVISCRINISI